MTKYKAYSEYKNTDEEWLKKIPTSWGFFAAKRIFASIRKSAVSSDEQLAASQKYGVVPQSLMMELNGSKVMLALKGTESFRHVEKNNFVISLRSFEGGIEHSNYEGCVSPAYTVLKSKVDIYFVYYKYLMKCNSFIAALQSSTDSLRDGKSISYEQFGTIFLPYCSIEEQQKIANFLDHETAKIDTLIDKQEKLIELLKEKRQAVISHAVTKGLNPDAPMKDSGVEWLGEVPAHWVVSRLGFHSKKIGSGKTSRGGAEIYQSEGILFLRSQNIYDEGLRISKNESTYISDEIHLEMQNTKVRPNDILLNITGGSIGRTCLVPEYINEANVNQHVCILRFKKILSEYMSFVLKSSATKEQIDVLQVGGNREGLNFEQIANLKFCLPPITELNEINSFIKNYLVKFEWLNLKANNAIELLKERKTALISAAVTGKIDVRDWQNKI